jgi:ubiquinone/menaquinone biosynthesis C-methylase UbiE
MSSAPAARGRLGDTPKRDYSQKLRLFSAFAEPELRAAIATLRLEPGMRVLDAGCGTGEMLAWLAAQVAPGGFAVGADLSESHLRSARAALPDATALLQGDLLRLPLAAASFDRVWSVNTVNHLTDPLAGVRRLAALLRPGGRLALGQSSLLADMYFAWDARLERVTTEAVRAYYRDRYQLTEDDLTGVRGLAGLLRESGLSDVSARTFVIERLAPLDARTRAWLLEVIFRGTWGERLRPYLATHDYEELMALCDPAHPRFALTRPDFHFLQTFTLAVASA